MTRDLENSMKLGVITAKSLHELVHSGDFEHIAHFIMLKFAGQSTTPRDLANKKAIARRGFALFEGYFYACTARVPPRNITYVKF
eukprot:1221392-Amphidinium_carterae.1